MKTKRKLLLGTFSFLAAGLLLIAAVLNDNLAAYTRGEHSDYQIVLNSTNTPSTLTTSFGNANTMVRYTTLNYENARKSSAAHVELNTGGLLYNPSTSQITSITSVTATFSTTGTITLATSYDGVNFTQTEITSGIRNDTTTKPYFFKLVANESTAVITEVTVTYSCIPHDGTIPSEKQYQMFFDYSYPNNSTAFTGNIASYVTTTGDFTLTNLAPTQIYAIVSGANDNVRVGTSKATGSLVFTFDKALEFNKIIIGTKKWASDNPVVKVTSGANATGITFNADTVENTLKTFDFAQSGPTNTLTIASTTNQRFHLYSVTLVGPGDGPVVDTGISAIDTKSYVSNDVYATSNMLDVKLNKSSGPAVTLNYDATGVDGYTYVVRNSSETVIDHTKAFGTAGTYYVDVAYKEFTARVTLAVGEYVPPATVTSVVAAESKLNYKIGDIYLNTNELVVTAYFSDSTNQVITYNADGVTGYNFIFFDPELNTHYPTNPFSVVGDYIFSVVYKGVESNDITITVGEATQSEATITFQTNSIVDSASVSDSQILGLLNTTNITVTSVTSAGVFGGSGAARVRMTSNSTIGSIKFNFGENVLITGVSLDVADYNGKTSNIKVVTSANTTGQTLAVSTGVTKLTYTAFSGDTNSSNSLTVSGIATGQQFYLYGINLTLGVSAPVAVTGVTLSDTSVSVAVNKTHTLIANVQPANATNKNVTWSSANDSIATVSSSGVVTGVSVGNTTVTVTTVDGGFTASASVAVTSAAYNNYYRASTVDPNFNLQDLQKASDLNAIPTDSATNPNILVIPIEFSDYQFSSKTIADINTLFNGISSATGYWESVKSFYYKTSFGKLDLQFTVADKYVTGLTVQEAAALPTDDGMQYFSSNLLRRAVSDYVTKNGANSTQQFDSDNDGFIDAVWLIYSCPNYSNSTTIRNISTDFWAYVFWDYTQNPNYTQPVQKVYAWASYDFMYEGGGTTKIDGHTYIHETGHLFGLEDYYNYDSDSTYKPTGGIDMMDFNVIDHNVWSKMALGWQKPYIVTGDAEITISPSQTNGDSILIADSWNGTSYDEFMMVELYTPTGLNTLDSTTQYCGVYPRGYTIPGIRLVHVDSRLTKIAYISGNWYYTGYHEPTTEPLSGYDYYYAVAHSNTPSRSYDAEYRLIHMIQATNVNTFKTGSIGTNADLFTAGQTFSMATYGPNFFKNGTLLNNNNALGYTIEIVSVSSTSATIRVHKL